MDFDILILYRLIILIFTQAMSVHLTEDQLYTQRVYIDPERLLRLKKERKPFKQVPSIFEPPTETQETHLTSSISNHKQSIVSTSIRQQQLTRQQIIPKNTSPNVDFIVSLLGEIKAEQIVEFQEGDCVNKQEDRCLILEGQVRVTGVGGRTFTLKEGNILFIHPQTTEKVREILCVKALKVLRLSEKIFLGLRSYIFLKNAEKIKYLKYCPFFIWADSLSQDLASAMTMQVYERGHYIYSRGDSAEQIFFVKEGVVLLERSVMLSNNILKEYQTHYERNQISQSQSTLIVKKGMVFGIDGILLKDVQAISIPKEGDNPEDHFQRRMKPTTRIYTARALGRTEVYVLDRQLLQGLFDVADMLQARIFHREMTKQDLLRICSDYTDMVVRKHRSLPKIAQAVTTKQMTLEPGQEQQELIEKKIKVKMVRQYEQNVKKHSIAHIIADSKSLKKSENHINQSNVIQQHFSQKLGVSLSEVIQQAGLAFPRLSSNLKKKRGSKKDPRSEAAEKYIIGWLKCEDPQKKAESVGKKTPKQGREKLSLINVRSYRSIVPSLV